jgi:hypothetical protein
MTPTAKVRIRYLVGGLLIGGFWYLNRGRSPWGDALHTIVVFAVLMVVMRARLRGKSVDIQLVPLLATKAVLVAAAALVEVGLKHSMGNAALVVSIGLALVVALLGPLADHRFFTRNTQPRTATPAPTTARSMR